MAIGCHIALGMNGRTGRGERKTTMKQSPRWTIVAQSALPLIVIFVLMVLAWSGKEDGEEWGGGAVVQVPIPNF
jgi:hypothetical protein